MDRSRRWGTKPSGAPSHTQPPKSSRLTLKPRKNRRRAGSLWSRVPRPAQVGDACGRAVRRSLPALVGLGVLGAVGGTAWAGYRFVTSSPRFAITTITVRGNHHVPTAQLLATLPARPGDNVFGTDLAVVAREVRQNPWIAGAEAHRILPHTLVVDVREHEPAALAALGSLYLVDAAGHPFKRAAIGAGEGEGLPIVTGIDRTAFEGDPAGSAALIHDALGALRTWRARPGRPAIGEVHVDGHGALTLRTYDAATAIQLGTLGPALARRMQTFDAVWADLTAEERARARAIHLEARPDHVTIAFTPPPAPADPLAGTPTKERPAKPADQ